VASKVLLFLSDRLSNWNCIDNIFLSSVLNTDVAHAKWNLLVHNHTLGIGTSVHDVDFSDDTDCSDTFGVELSCHLEAVRGSHIGVGWHDAKNDSSWVANVSVGHGASNLLNVIRLISNSNTSYTR
jgi:hypothetical protein